MILIVGDTHDDVLYFETVLVGKDEQLLFNRFRVRSGSIASQQVLVVHNMSTSVLAAASITELINYLDKQEQVVDLVICVGKCLSGCNNLKHGDIALSGSVIDANVDLSKLKDVGLAEIPGFSREFPSDFKVQEDIYRYLSENLERRPNIDHYRATYLSSDNLSLDMVKFLKEHNTLFGKSDEKYVIDANSAGVAIACTLKDIPFVCLKVVEASIDEAQNLDTYAKVLSRYIDLGKGIVQTLSNIGRTDILEGDE